MRDQKTTKKKKKGENPIFLSSLPRGVASAMIGSSLRMRPRQGRDIHDCIFAHGSAKASVIYA